MIAVRAGAATHPGRVRESNQDAFCATDGVWAVCDGVGGHRGGETASTIAVEVLREGLHEATTAGLVLAVQTANRRVWERSVADPALRGMATTLTAAALVDGAERIAIVNVGDSRAYLFRDGELTRISEDHSLVEALVREGRISRAEAEVHPQRALITRALGLEPDVEVDHWEIVPYASDRILLCTDGLTTEVSEDRIAAVLCRLADPDEAARELVREAVAAGGRDNVTVVVVDVVDDGGAARSASAALAHEPLTAAARSPEVSAGEPDATSSETDRDGDVAAAPGPLDTGAPARGPLGWRTGAFVGTVVLVVGVALAAVGWYARRTWYVGVADGTVAVYRGRPGGLLWFDPTLERDTGIPLGAVRAPFAQDIRAGKPFASRADAEDYVRRVVAAASTTTTTAPAGTAPP